jgi:hypothetical protein
MSKRIDSRCARCGPLVVDATAVEVFHDQSTGSASYSFGCAGCGEMIVGDLHEAIVALLAHAGARVTVLCRSPELPGGSRIDAPLTELNVAAAAALLDRIDPIVALLAIDG